jgi:hypothetical protein
MTSNHLQVFSEVVSKIVGSLGLSDLTTERAKSYLNELILEFAGQQEVPDSLWRLFQAWLWVIE